MNKPGTPAGLGGTADLASLADDLVRAFVASGKNKPVLPTGRREELVSALTRMMVDDETLDAFVGELERARMAHGVHLALFKQLTSDLPDEVIARGGFGVLADEQLADIAIDPSALHALSDYLWCELDPDSELPEPEWGDWWWKAVSSGEPAQPGLVRSLVANTGGESVPAPKEEQIIPFDPARTTSRPRAPRWLGHAAAIAASLLLGVFIGKTAFEGGGEGSGSYPLVSSAPVYGAGRGTERDLSIRFTSDLQGFATVVALRPGNRPEVYPALGRDDVAVQTRVPTEFSPLPAGTKEAVVVVTETPAADPVRRALRDRSDETGDASSLLTFLEPHLRTKGYRRISIGIIRFDSE